MSWGRLAGNLAMAHFSRSNGIHRPNTLRGSIVIFWTIKKWDFKLIQTTTISQSVSRIYLERIRQKRARVSLSSR